MRRRRSVDYGVALLAVAAALALRWLLGPWLQTQLPYVTLFGAVALSVWHGGLGPAILAALVGLGIADQGFANPGSGMARAAGFLGYAASCGLIIGLGESLRRTRARLEQEVLERRRVERAALSHAERLDATLLSIGAGVIVTDAEGRVERLNPVAERLTGWAVAEAHGQPLAKVLDIVHADNRETVVDPPVWRALAEGRVVGLDGPTVLISRDGSERPIDDCAAPIRGPGGRIEGAVMVFRDIGAHRSVERDLARPGRRLETHVTAAPVAIVVVDRDPQRVRVWNPAAAALFGWREDEVLGRRLPGGLDAVADECARLLAEPQSGRMPIERELSRPRRDGRPLRLRLSCAALQDAAGRSGGLLLMFSDASEAGRAAAAEARLASLVRHAGEAILTAGFDGLVWSWNPAAEALFGYRAEERVGRPLEALTPPDRAAEERRLMARLQAGEAVRVETVRMRKDGRPLEVLLSVAPLRDERARLVGFAAFYQDLSARGAAEAALRRGEA
jgi:two-component system CheB/CheR fusion protein